MRNQDLRLHIRLKSCLQAILELEAELMEHEIGRSMVTEFRILRSMLQRLPSIPIAEQDVEKVEEATSVFLKELRTPLKGHRDQVPKVRQLH